MMNDEKRKNLQALKESIEILKEYSESPEYVFRGRTDQAPDRS